MALRWSVYTELKCINAMNIIHRVYIDGFWGDRTMDIKLFPDVNFFIGVNGSGKTTLINIIAAAISADFSTLDKLPFKLIRIEFVEVGGKKRPQLEVEKKRMEKSPYTSIVYRIKEKATDKYREYSLDEFEEERMLRRGYLPNNYRMYMRQMNRGVVANLQEILNVTWLSIHRGASRNSGDEKNFESSVDQKLDELGRGLGKYFSVLFSKVSVESTKFQQNIVSSMLMETRQKNIVSLIKAIELEKEKDSLFEIFNKFNVPLSSVEDRFDKYFEAFDNAKKKLVNKESIGLSEALVLLNIIKSHKAVEEWNEFLEKQDMINKPKQVFVDVLNGLFQRKKIRVNDKSEIEAITDSGKVLPIGELSSGEKQLIIILGEALLQQSTPWIYIADEPELSLHIKWQENLIENLRKLNPYAQIICATHSPDVVGMFSDKVFDMEDQIK
jgi:predicted ATPase